MWQLLEERTWVNNVTDLSIKVVENLHGLRQGCGVGG